MTNAQPSPATNQPKTGRITETIRKAILGSGKSCYRIAHSTGLHVDTVAHFAHGRTTIKLDTLDRIADLLGWDIEIVPRPLPTDQPTDEPAADQQSA